MGIENKLHGVFTKARKEITMSNTILLVQPNQRPETRTYSDYESLNECLEGICKIFEEHLKRLHPHDPSITYDISQLFEFIDQLTDLSCLVFQKSYGTYTPHNKDWLKEKILGANYMDIKSLLHLGCAKIATLIKGKS